MFLSVKGYMYEAHVEGLGRKGYDTTYIHIPDMMITIDPRRFLSWKVDPEFPLGSSKKAKEVSKQYFKECNNDKRKVDPYELKTLRGKAAEESSTVVEIPYTVAKEILDFLNENEEQDPYKITDISIKKLACEILNEL